MAKYLDNIGTAHLIEKVKEISVKTIEPNGQYLKDFEEGVYRVKVGGTLFYTTQYDEVTASAGDILSIEIENYNVKWAIIGNGHQFWGTANADGSGTSLEGEKSPIISVDSIEGLEPTTENFNLMYLYDRQLYKWFWISQTFTNTTGKLLNATNGAEVSPPSSLSASIRNSCCVTSYMPINNIGAYNKFITNSTVLNAGGFLGVCYYDENHTFISSTALTQTTTLTQLENVPSNARYVKFSHYFSLLEAFIFYTATLHLYAVQQTFTANQLYGTGSDGVTTTFAQSSNVTGNAFVKRKSDGQIRVPNTPSNNADATSKVYVDGLTTPSSWTTATASSNILGGVCQYATIGKLVLVHMADVTIKSGTSAHEALLFSGLPTPNQDFITVAVGHSITTTPIRFHVLSNGNIILHYSDTGSFGDQYAHHYADFCYIKS